MELTKMLRGIFRWRKSAVSKILTAQPPFSAQVEIYTLAPAGYAIFADLDGSLSGQRGGARFGLCCCVSFPFVGGGLKGSHKETTLLVLN